jgi:acetyl-CoA carboxylase carboxyltransferase component
MKKDMESLIKTLDEMNDIVSDADGARAAKQHKKGKLTARERIHLLLDEDSFVETDAFVMHQSSNFGLEKNKILGDGVVTGFGTVNGRPIYVFSQDFTFLGGALGEAYAKKIVKIQDLAIQNGAPMIGINDSGGARIQEGVDSLHGYGDIFYRNVMASGVIPQISVIVGPCAGGAVYSPALTDFVFMVKNVSNMFITGPQVIKQVTGESVSAEDLGGGYAQTAISGNGHFLCEDEKECFAAVRKLLWFIPPHNMTDSREVECTDPSDRMAMELRTAVPIDSKKSYDVRDVIGHIVDDGEFMESQANYAGNIVTGFARLDGISVGIIANQPLVMAGCLDINASDKGARFIRFCDCFNLPVITFVDVPGYLPGKAQEHAGIIRHGAKILYAYSEATVPKITITLRKSYGGASVAMASREMGTDILMAWPQAEIAVMGAAGAANIIFRKEILAAPEGKEEEVRQECLDNYEDAICNPYEAAKRGYLDLIIKPEETRPRLIQSLRVLKHKQAHLPAKKHGNMPL